MEEPKIRTYKGKEIPDMDDPYELAGELMSLDNQPEGDEQLTEEYFQLAERLIVEWEENDLGQA